MNSRNFSKNLKNIRWVVSSFFVCCKTLILQKTKHPQKNGVQIWNQHEILVITVYPIYENTNLVYENTTIQSCKKICHSLEGSCGEKLKIFYFFSYGPPQIWSGSAKNYFFYFCYLIRVEHEKWSEMCVWVVGFSQKMRKLDLKISTFKNVPMWGQSVRE